jgi:hypothetical protein
MVPTRLPAICRTALWPFMVGVWSKICAQRGVPPYVPLPTEPRSWNVVAETGT